MPNKKSAPYSLSPRPNRELVTKTRNYNRPHAKKSQLSVGCGQRQAGAARSARPSYGAGKQNETAPTLWKFSSLPTGWRPCSTVPGACSDPHLWVTDSTHCVCTELASGSVLFEDTSGLLWRLGTRPGLLEAFWPPALGPPRPRPHPSRQLPWAPPPLLLRLLPPPPQVVSVSFSPPEKSTTGHAAVNDGRAWGLRRGETTGQG